jgi:signal transduction histidine kinase/CheY-like chemotaxis protein
MIADLDSRNGTLMDGAPVSHQGQPLAYGAVLQLGAQTYLFAPHDRAGDKLLELQKMDALGRLAAGAAHDFRNLLAVMHGNVAYVLNLLKAGTANIGEMIESLSETDVAIGRATELTERLLTMARPKTGDEERVDFSQLVEEVAGLLKHGRANVKVEAEVERGLVVRGEPSRLHQMVMNLGVNGCDAMSDGGSLTLRVRRGPSQRARGMVIGPCVELEVVDSGVGIEETIRSRIFEPFFSTKGDSGTGLGLATVYSVVRHHGGDISVESEPGEGTAFRVLLPIGEQQRARLETLNRVPSVEVQALSGQAVLIVDDEPMVLSASKRLLESWGYLVYIAEGSAEAVERFEELHGKVGCAVVDVQMPGLDGLALLRILRMIEPGLRAIVTSARVDVDAIRGELGSRDVFVPKPHGATLRTVLEEFFA